MMLIDASYSYKSDMAIYPGNPTFSIKRVQDIEKGDSANVSMISIGSHTGTHIDAPSHFISNGKTIDEIPLEAMNGRAKLLDLRGYSEIGRSLLERYHIEEKDIVILKTDNSENFHGNEILNDYVTLDYDAAEYLAGKRVKMVCIDYMTIERPRAKRIAGKSVHRALLQKEVLIAEALNLSNVEEGSYHLYCFPLNIVGADGVPVRIVLSGTLNGEKG